MRGQVAKLGQNKSLPFPARAAKCLSQPWFPPVVNARVKITLKLLRKSERMGVIDPGLRDVGHFPTQKEQLTGSQRVLRHDDFFGESAGCKQSLDAVGCKAVGAKGSFDPKCVPALKITHLAPGRIVEESGVGLDGAGAGPWQLPSVGHSHTLIPERREQQIDRIGSCENSVMRQKDCDAGPRHQAQRKLTRPAMIEIAMIDAEDLISLSRRQFPRSVVGA